MKKPHIVIIDDSSVSLRILVQFLSDCYRLTPFSSVIESIGFLRKNPVADLILLDIDMPECDGNEAFPIIREIPGMEDVPIIFVTARTDIESEISAFNLGVVDYIKKPVIPAIAKKRIQLQIDARLREKRMLNEINAISRLAEDAVKIIVDGKGSDFGSEICGDFLKTYGDFKIISEALND